MDRNRASFTAKGIAALRALESARPEDERICYDPLARRMISPIFYFLCRLSTGYGRRVAPGVQEFLAARCRYIDDFLRARLDEGFRQIVILGAGLDSRAYRFKLPEGVKVFEVDHPASQRAKLRKVKELLGSLPGNVVYVPLDFNREGLEKLSTCGYHETQKTVFVWEGVTHYLTAEAVDATLSFIKSHSGPGSTLVFDYVNRSALEASRKRGEVRRMQRYRGFTGEGLVFGLQEGHEREFLAQRGFSTATIARKDDLKKACFSEKRRADPIAEIYALASAWT
jgi:methyltransferase (TIGR00027 family)